MVKISILLRKLDIFKKIFLDYLDHVGEVGNHANDGIARAMSEGVEATEQAPGDRRN